MCIRDRGKQTTPHFKLKEREDKPSSEWIRVEGTHEEMCIRDSPGSDPAGFILCGMKSLYI